MNANSLSVHVWSFIYSLLTEVLETSQLHCELFYVMLYDWTWNHIFCFSKTIFWPVPIDST